MGATSSRKRRAAKLGNDDLSLAGGGWCLRFGKEGHRVLHCCLHTETRPLFTYGMVPRCQLGATLQLQALRKGAGQDGIGLHRQLNAFVAADFNSVFCCGNFGMLVVSARNKLVRSSSLPLILSFPFHPKLKCACVHVSVCWCVVRSSPLLLIPVFHPKPKCACVYASGS